MGYRRCKSETEDLQASNTSFRKKRILRYVFFASSQAPPLTLATTHAEWTTPAAAFCMGVYSLTQCVAVQPTPFFAVAAGAVIFGRATRLRSSRSYSDATLLRPDFSWSQPPCCTLFISSETDLELLTTPHTHWRVKYVCTRYHKERRHVRKKHWEHNTNNTLLLARLRPQQHWEHRDTKRALGMLSHSPALRPFTHSLSLQDPFPVDGAISFCAFVLSGGGEMSFFLIFCKNLQKLLKTFPFLESH